MCRPASFIYHREKGVLSHPTSDSHSDIVSYHRLLDEQDFIKVEIVPPNKDFLAAQDLWIFVIDQQHYPPWVNKVCVEQHVREHLPEWILSRTYPFVGNEHPEIVFIPKAAAGNIYIHGDASVYGKDLCCNIIGSSLDIHVENSYIQATVYDSDVYAIDSTVDVVGTHNVVIGEASNLKVVGIHANVQLQRGKLDSSNLALSQVYLTDASVFNNKLLQCDTKMTNVTGNSAVDGGTLTLVGSSIVGDIRHVKINKKKSSVKRTKELTVLVKYDDTEWGS